MCYLHSVHVQSECLFEEGHLFAHNRTYRKNTESGEEMMWCGVQRTQQCFVFFDQYSKWILRAYSDYIDPEDGNNMADEVEIYLSHLVL